MIKKAIPALAVMAAFGVYADTTPTVTIESAAQRWPWNNKIDIKYTVGNGSVPASGVYRKIKFALSVDGQVVQTVDGSRDVIANADTGTHTVTYELPSGIKSDNCSITAEIYETTGYYMIIDLESGNMAFEDLESGDSPTATPTASNARYNTETYKTKWMAFRKVPSTARADAAYSAGYRTGHSGYESSNTPTNWVTASDFFVGVFPCTKTQYLKIQATGTDGSTPVGSLTWAALRGSKTPTQELGSSESSTSFFERLNALTGKSGFDLPTEVMWEIAARANSDKVYPWGDSENSSYFVSYGTLNTVAVVGSKKSNAWGLFDMIGNVFEWCRDDESLANLADAPDAFTPAYSPSASTTSHRCRGGSNNAGKNNLKASHRPTYSSSWVDHGFRVFWRAQ